MLNFSKSDEEIKLIYTLDAWGRVHIQQIFIFA